MDTTTTTTTTAPSPSPVRRSARRFRPTHLLAVPVVVALGAVGALVADVAVQSPPRPIVLTAASDASPSSPAGDHISNTSTVDIQALWRVMLQLGPEQSAVVVPALDPDVRAALAAIVHGIVYEGLVDGVEGA